VLPYVALLKKTSIYLDEELDHRLARRAAEEGITKAEFIRRSLAGIVQRPGRPKPSFVGFTDDGPTDLSADPDRYLDGFGE
jgi:Ribbon-helix-helix protein, copG family